MRILVLIHEFPPVGGGGGRVALDISSELARAGHDVVLITAHFKDLPKEEWVEGVRVIRVSSFRRQAFRADLLAMGAFIISACWSALRLVSEWRPDLVHVHFAVPAGAIAWLFYRLRRIPYILTAHLGDVPGGVPEKTGGWFRWFYPLTPPIWKNASRVVAVGEYTRQLAAEYYPVDIEVIPNGVDLSDLDPGEIRLSQPPRIIFAGRFMPQKNPLQVISTLAQLSDLDWQCVMIGDGPLYHEIESKRIQMGLRERVELTGWIKPEEVVDWFRKSDILFIPSLSEGFPVVGVQSLALGLAFIVSHIGGGLDLVQHNENGYLVESGDTEEYVSYLHSLLTNPERLLEFRRASRQKAHQFDIALIADRYERLFQNAVSAP